MDDISRQDAALDIRDDLLAISDLCLGMTSSSVEAEPYLWRYLHREAQRLAEVAEVMAEP